MIQPKQTRMINMSKNIIVINGYSAVVSFDSDINMLRGEFIGLNGGADFYASTIDNLHHEAKISLDTFLQVCAEKGIEPVKQFSGKFNARIPPELHEKLVIAATAHGKSLNDFVRQAIEHEIAYA